MADHAGVGLMLAMLFFFSSKSLSNVPAGVMAIVGFLRFLSAPRAALASPLVRVLLVLFGCLWLPMLLALTVAVNPARAAEATWPYLRFLGMGFFVIWESRREGFWPKLNLGACFIIAFWCLDALLQYFLGRDLFGYPAIYGSVYGVFYPNITLGDVAAALSPIYFHALYSLAKRWAGWWILLVPLVMAVVLSGRRAAWIMLLVSIVGYVGYLFWISPQKRVLVRRMMVPVVLVLLTMVLTVTTSPFLKNRLAVTSGLFSNNYSTINAATASRLPLWTTAVNIICTHWLRGIGPRGYRYVYTQYSRSDDPFHVEGSTHPHQLVLEVLVETGVIGIAGLLLFVLVGYHFLQQYHLGAALFPWCLAVIAATFPLNTHMAFYGSYWSSLLWWQLLLIFIGAATEMRNTAKLEGRSPGNNVIAW